MMLNTAAVCCLLLGSVALCASSLLRYFGAIADLESGQGRSRDVEDRVRCFRWDNPATFP